MHEAAEQHGKPGKLTFILAHGAGAGKGSDFMQAFANGLSERGVEVILFDFPYMIKRSEDGKKRPPDRAPKLMDHYREVIASIERDNPVIIGGKSMGGRIASMLLAEENTIADGLLLLGYPFSPPGKPEKLRVEHFPEIEKPTLIIQGERDVFGGRALVDDLATPSNFHIAWSPDGDHSFKPRKASGLTEQENWLGAMDAIMGHAW